MHDNGSNLHLILDRHVQLSFAGARRRAYARKQSQGSRVIEDWRSCPSCRSRFRLRRSSCRGEIKSLSPTPHARSLNSSPGYLDGDLMRPRELVYQMFAVLWSITGVPIIMLDLSIPSLSTSPPGFVSFWERWLVLFFHFPQNPEADQVAFAHA